MITLQEYERSLLLELDIVKHLFTKIPKDAFEYRPTPGQRSMLELLRYLARYAALGLRVRIDNDTASFAALEEQGSGITSETFPAAMDAQIAEVRMLLAGLTPEQLAEEIDPYKRGTTTTRAYQLLALLKQYTAYKMQLFLYIKAAGNTDISTPNLWAGKDPGKKA